MEIHRGFFDALIWHFFLIFHFHIIMQDHNEDATKKNSEFLFFNGKLFFFFKKVSKYFLFKILYSVRNHLFFNLFKMYYISLIIRIYRLNKAFHIIFSIYHFSIISSIISFICRGEGPCFSSYPHIISQLLYFILFRVNQQSHKMCADKGWRRKLHTHEKEK